MAKANEIRFMVTSIVLPTKWRRGTGSIAVTLIG